MRSTGGGQANREPQDRRASQPARAGGQARLATGWCARVGQRAQMDVQPLGPLDWAAVPAGVPGAEAEQAGAPHQDQHDAKKALTLS